MNSKSFSRYAQGKTCRCLRCLFLTYRFHHHDNDDTCLGRDDLGWDQNVHETPADHMPRTQSVPIRDTPSNGSTPGHHTYGMAVNGRYSNMCRSSLLENSWTMLADIIFKDEIIINWAIYMFFAVIFKNSYPDGCSMGDFHLLDVSMEHVVRQTMDCPGRRRGAILGAVNRSPAVRHVHESSLPSLRKGFQCILQCNKIFVGILT